MTVPADFPATEIAEYLQENHSGPDNAGREYAICEALGISDRRFREWLETQRDFPIASNDRGVWYCTCARDWNPAIRWSVRAFLAWKKRWKRQVWMRQNFHPRAQLFDDKRYGRAA
ncbi:MAG: hypothetical protein ACYC99_08930 [Candidatus Geothermincolia bacterium]